MNQISRERDCSVLDFAGGTGFVYFRIRSTLLDRARVSWHVVDQEPLLELGKQAADAADRITFRPDLPAAGSRRFDVVYVNTALQ